MLLPVGCRQGLGRCGVLVVRLMEGLVPIPIAAREAGGTLRGAWRTRLIRSFLAVRRADEPEPRLLTPGGRRLAGILVLVTALLVALYAPVFVEFGNAWLSYEEYNYAVLIPFIALFLLWRRWSRLRTQPLQPEARGGILLGVGLTMLLLGVATGVHVAQGLSFIPVVLGLTWFLWGRGAARVVVFPVAYLACGLGLYRGLASTLGFQMQGITAHYATDLAGILGAHAQRDGLLLTLGKMQFIVAEHCSGLGSLLALFALGWLVAGEGPGSLPYKILLCLAIAPLALIANIIRVALVMVIAQDVS